MSSEMGADAWLSFIADPESRKKLEDIAPILKMIHAATMIRSRTFGIPFLIITADNSITDKDLTEVAGVLKSAIGYNMVVIPESVNLLLVEKEDAISKLKTIIEIIERHA